MTTPTTTARVTIVCTHPGHAHYGQHATINDIGPLPQERICKLIDRAAAWTRALCRR